VDDVPSALVEICAGYLAAGLPEFVEYFAHNDVQLPLAKGDVVFFNPHCSTVQAPIRLPTSGG